MLKIIAMLTMFIDHFGSHFMHNNFTMRFIGRIAFIVYCFLLVESFINTNKENRFKHLIRLFILFLITEIPFDLLNSNKILEFNTQNTILTLFIGFSFMFVFEQLEDLGWMKYISIPIFALLNIYLRGEYSWYGIVLIELMYLFRKGNKKYKFWQLFLIIFIFTCLQYSNFYMNYGLVQMKKWIIYGIGLVNLGNLLAVPIMYLYNGKNIKSSYFFTWFYRLFYPLHLLLLYLVHIY